MKREIQAIKEEFSSDEKMLEGVFRIEAILRKYKKFLITLGILICIGIIAIGVRSYLKEENAKVSTQLMQELLKDPKDQQKWALLQQKNPTLYEFMQFSQAISANQAQALEPFLHSSNPFIAHYATYEFASLKQSFASEQFGEFSALALLQEGYLALKAKQRAEALQKFAQIAQDTEIKELANRIGHYGIHF